MGQSLLVSVPISELINQPRKFQLAPPSISRAFGTRHNQFPCTSVYLSTNPLPPPAQDGGAVFAKGTGTAEVVLSSHESIFYHTTFSNCKFIRNTAREAGGAIEIIVGRAHVDNTVFSGNVASVGGALRLLGAMELFNSTFSNNKSGEGGGPAISSAGSISKMIGLNFSANSFLCANTEFLDSNKASILVFENVFLQVTPRWSAPWNMEPCV